MVILSVPVESCLGRDGAAIGDLDPRGEDFGEKEEVDDATSRAEKTCSDMISLVTYLITIMNSTIPQIQIFLEYKWIVL